MSVEPAPVEPEAGPLWLRRLPTEPDWLCNGAYRDEYDRTWHCGHATHPLGHHHQSWVFTKPDGTAGEVDWEHRREWSGGPAINVSAIPHRQTVPRYSTTELREGVVDFLHRGQED